MLDLDGIQIRDPNSIKAKNALEGRIGEMRESLRNQPPFALAGYMGASYTETGPGQGEFRLSLWESEILVSTPEFEVFDSLQERFPGRIQALVLYYFITAKGTPLRGDWVSFADLPGGRMYSPAFQGYSGDQIVKACGMRLDAFESACCKAGGHKVEGADAAYFFHGLPRVSLLVTYWLGEAEFPSASKVLFDSAACHYLPLDGCAILGSMLTQRILRAL